MGSLIRGHMRANVVGYVALFVALSGTAYALGANTIGSRQIKNNAVKSIDLKDGGGVTGADVGDNSLTGGDINEGTLGKVGDSGMLDGINSSGFLGAGATAADSQQLDGRDSTGFIKTTTLQVIGPHTFTEGHNQIATAGNVEFYGDCLAGNATRISINSAGNYSYAVQGHAGAAGDKGGVDTGGVQYLADATAAELAQPVTGFVKSPTGQMVFNLYQMRDTNILGQSFCVFGGYIVVS